MGVIPCTLAQELAPELSIGVLDGAERADVLEHLEHCPSCRAFLEELTQVAEAALLLVPEIEPPLGFESKVGEQLGLPLREPALLCEPALHARGRTRLLARASAAVIAVAAASGLGVWIAQAAGHPPTRAQAVAPTPNRSMRAQLFNELGQPVGQVIAHSGRPGWVFMTVDNQSAGGWVVCYLETAAGKSVRLGTFDIYEGHGSWGAAAPVSMSQLRGARLVGATGATVAVASF